MYIRYIHEKLWWRNSRRRNSIRALIKETFLKTLLIGKKGGMFKFDYFVNNILFGLKLALKDGLAMFLMMMYSSSDYFLKVK